MNQLRTKQEGFGAVEIIIICLVIVVIGAAGFFVYRNSHKTSKAASTSTTTTSQTEQAISSAQPAQTAQQYLVIKEWNVQLTLDNNTSSLYYYIKPELPSVAYLSLKTVSDIAPNCAADKFSMGAISRLTPDEHDNALRDPTNGIPGSIHIVNYWFGFTSPQAGCIETSAQSDAVNKAQSTVYLGDIFKTLQAVPATSRSN